MASNDEYPLPVSIDDQNTRQSARHLPRFFRSEQNEKFLSGVLDPLLQPGKLDRINGYVGRKDIPNFKFNDNYQTDINTTRQYYQLEPGFVYEDPKTGEPVWFSDYADYMNSLAYYGANTSNHAKLNAEEAYSWDPSIDWDKFVNFREYYWLPSGPDPINIYGTQIETVSTFTVNSVIDGNRSDFIFTPDGLTINPRLTLYRGNTYTFKINSNNKLFGIKTQPVVGNSYFYNFGVSTQNIDRGIITFTVPYEAPDLLYYIDNNDIDSQGMIDIRDIDEDTFLDVEAEIIGKTNYISTTGIKFVNGLKLKFIGNISPAKYSNGFWYVEGVGTAITLTKYSDLESTPLTNDPTDLPFDLQPFDSVPFENANNYPNVKEYLVINRSSRDRNPWTRNNRWFHISVIETTAIANGQIASPDQITRAHRPIIEFLPNIKLYQNGWIAKQDVDLIDTTTTDVFSTIEGSLGYYVDGEKLIPGHRVLFTADIDPLVNGKIYEVSTITVNRTTVKFLSAACTLIPPYLVTFTFDTLVTPPSVNFGYTVEGNSNSNYAGLYNAVASTTSSLTLLYPINPGIFGTGTTTGTYDNFGSRPQLTLIPTTDSNPIDGEVAYAKAGNSYRGSSFYYNGTKWQQSQKKTSKNQAPLFDLFDENEISFSDSTVYPSSSFSGNRIFGYRIGPGAADTELGFPLYYRSIDNIGDIEFEFDLENRSWNYIKDSALSNVYSYQGFLRKALLNGSFRFLNGWTQTVRSLYQKAVRILEVTESTDLIAIDIFNNSEALGDINAQIYVNNIKRNDISRVNINGLAYIKFSTALLAGDQVVYKIQTIANKNARGYYEIPYNWQNNPFNETLGYFTLGEAIDHVRTIVENNPAFSGSFPGISNLPVLGNVSKFGHRFLQHSGSFPLAAYLITDKKNNIIDALQWTSTQYTQFKKEFLRIAGVAAFEGSISERVDQVLLEFSKSKYLDKSPFYFSDMAPYKGYTQRDYIVQDTRLPVFVIDSIFNPQSQTRRSVLIYVNEVQLVYLVDYTFSKTDAFVNISFPLHKNDIITIKDYVSTNGSYIPYTPSSLGLYPSYEPKVFIDDTYITPVKVIQGHDGSIVVAYNDYRDDLIMELEKRIYNTRRINYNSNIFNIHNVISGYYRNSPTTSFFTRNEFNNIVLPDFLKWNSLTNKDYSSNSYITEGNSFTYNYSNFFAIDGITSLPGWWRAIYQYAYDTDRPHSHPWEMQGFTIKPVWWDTVYGKAPYTSENTLMWTAIERGIINTPNYRRSDIRYARPGLINNLPVDDQGNLLSPLDSNFVKDFSLVNARGNYTFGDGAPVEAAWRRTSEYPFSVIKAMCILSGSEFIGKMWDRFTIKRNIAGQIYNTKTGKRFNTADIVYPNTPMGNIDDPTVPRSMSNGLSNIIDDYVFSLNAVSVDTYKDVVTGLNTKLSHRLGGYTSKDKLNVLLDSRSPTASGTVFLPQDNYNIFYDQSAPVASVVYSGVLIEKINLIDQSGYRITGYDKKYGIFQIFPSISSKNDSGFNVGGVTEAFSEWTPTQYYTKGYIVKYKNRFYRAIAPNTSSEKFEDDSARWSPLNSLPITGGISALNRTRFSDTVKVIPYGTVFQTVQDVVDFLLGYQEKLKSDGFKFDDFNKELGITLDWLTSAKEFMFWTLQNWNSGSIITLSPSATNLQFTPVITASIDDFSSSAFEYSILKADGTPFRLNLIDIHRKENGFTVKPNVAGDGIYFIRANLIQREHILLLDNESDFNDVVYDKISGYRQGRIKLIGFRTSKWDGGYTTPGFMYDSAIINPWQPFTDYNLGDIVSYKNNSFVAIVNVSGSADFVFSNWKEQEKILPTGLMANWDYRIEQFRDFYDLNASIFDDNQKKLARHLIGYQDRSYLDNIIIDDVAQFKFYQGYIREKGTFNSITKLFDVLRSSGFSTVNLYEDWAFKVGDYGASDAYSEIEFPLDEKAFRHNPQDVVLTANPEYQTDLSIYNVSSSMVTIKPFSYNAKPFPTKNIDTELNDYGIFKYQVAGYVREDDVDHVLYDRAALLNYDITQFRNSDKIWLAYTENNDWDVLEYIKVDLIITTWTVDFVTNSHIYLYCDGTDDLARGDVISISNLGLIDGSYIIQDVSDNIITIYTLSILATIPNLVTSGVIHRLKSVRYKNLMAVSDKIYNRFDILGEKIWIDQDLSGNWLVLENKDAFFNNAGTNKSDEILPYTKINNQQNGYEIKISGNNLYMVVSSPFKDRGSVIIYRRPNNLSKWSYSQTLKIPSDYISFLPNDQFGKSLDISYDGLTIAIGIPLASNLRSLYKGIFSEQAGYNQNDIVTYFDDQDTGFMYRSKIQVNSGTGSSFVYDNWDLVSSYTGSVLPSATPSGLTNQGVVAIFKYDGYTNRFKISNILGSADPVSYEQFGSKVKFVEDTTSNNLVLFVSATGYSTDTVFKTTTESSVNSNIITVNNTTGIKVGQLIVGLIDPITETNITTKVTGTTSTHIYLDQYVTIDINEQLQFKLQSIGRVHVLVQTSNGWQFNNVEPFVDPFKNPLVDIFPPASFDRVSNSKYGYDFDCLSDLSTIAVSSPFTRAGTVYVFEITTQSYESFQSKLNGINYLSFRLFEVISSETLIDGSVPNLIGGYISAEDAFGYKVILSKDLLLVSAPNNNSKGNHVGAIFNFQKVNETYQLQQSLIPPVTNTYAYERFGTTLSIDPLGDILSIGAAGGPSVLDTTFDSYAKGLYSEFSFNLDSIVKIEGTGPYYVNFNITDQEFSPPVDLFYTISGNSNENYSGNFIATTSTNSTITFKYDDFPGQFGTGITKATNLDLKYVLDTTSTSLTPTTFDNNSTKFYDQIPFTGAVYVYNKFDDQFIYADRLTPSDNLSAQDNFGFSICTSSNCIAIGAPNKSFAGISYGSVFIFNYSSLSWNRLREATPLVDIDKFKKSFYYNTTTNTLIGNLDLYDPLKGRIPGIADQEIKYQTYYDPAVYQYNGDTTLAINNDQIWTDTHIGEVWWDLSTIKYTWYEQGDVTYRNLQWGKLFPGSIVNVYEWVESKYLPSKYQTLADTTAGLAEGISGIPKDTTDTTYSTKIKYDTTSGIITTLYYFWVNNRRVAPSFMNRKLSANDIANLIADPKSQGYRSISITSENSLSLTNIKPKLLGTNVSLNLQFYEIDNTELAIHREYVLIPKGDRYANIPKILEKKWFDSLIGLDIVGNTVPDNNLSIRQRYGNFNSPRQSWFVNRSEALKQTIEYVNSVLQNQNLLDEINLKNLEKQEIPPTLESGEIDLIVNSLEELSYIGTNGLLTAQISLTLRDGKIIDWFIDNKGRGYGKNKLAPEYGDGVWAGPTAKIVSATGSGGELKTYVNSYGEVIWVEITKQGQGYTEILGNTGTDIGTTVVVRDFTVLVLSDVDALNSWSLQTWSFVSDFDAISYRNLVQNNLGLVTKNYPHHWLKTRTQSYNVTRYWSFVDWYASGFTAQSDIKFIIDRTDNLSGLPSDIGDLVKVTNAGLNSWLLLLKIANTNDPDFTIDYQVVGEENATIQFSSALYNFNSEIGYDEKYSYDLDLYDSNPTTELRIILEAIRDDIFVEELRIEYVNLFFNTIHYILSEQHFTDWFFKTSFLKMNQIVGNLNQNATFQTDPLADYESYIEEVKPYKTKIREFVSSYQGYDYSYNTVTDFDLPSYFNLDTGNFETTDLYSSYITKYPWANWLENHTYQVVDIVINQKGSGYISKPTVVISPPIENSIVWNKLIPLDESVYVSFNHNYYLTGTTGVTGSTPPTHTTGSVLNGTVIFTYVATDASATAYIGTGSLFAIEIDNPGYGFLSSPIITIRGGNGPINFVQATAVAHIGNNKARSITLKMKFDRYLKNYYVNDFSYTDTFQAINESVFKLTYAPEIEKSKFTITVNDIEYYGSQYSVSIKQETHDTYNSIIGNIVFASLVTGIVVIKYYKNIGIYGAADRINYAYSPTSGQYGKDLSQLMTGIDYGGVEFTSIAFNIVGGWDILNWDISSWDTIVTTNDDYVVTFSNNNSGIISNQFTLPYIPATGEIINTYLKIKNTNETVRIDSTDHNINYQLTIEGNPIYSLNGAFNNTSSVEFNTLEYTVTVVRSPVYNVNTLTTNILIDVFTTGDSIKFEYPQPLTGWKIGSKSLTSDSIRYNYNTWSIEIDGDRQLDFILNSTYKLTPILTDHIVISDPIDNTLFDFLFDFENDDFTIELFVKPAAEPDNDWNPILTIGRSQGGVERGKEIRIGYNIDNSGVGYLIPNNSNNANVYNGFGSLELDTWSHIALTRKGSSVYFFINGILKEEITNVDFTFSALGPLQIGYGLYPADGYFKGSVSNVRVLKGTGLYTVNFLVPNSPLMNIENTSLLVLDSQISLRSFNGNGINNVIDIGILGNLRTGDQLTFRKTTSDGTILPNDQSLLDSLISGGDLAYISAKGITPDEIIIDGDDFVSAETNHGPEELVQGHVVDTVDIKVYDAPASGGPRITIDNYIGDGITSTYPLGVLPPNEDAVIVFINKLFQNSINVDFANKTVTLVTDDNLSDPPPLNSKVTIFIIDTAGYDILSREIIVADGETRSFLTGARYTANDVSAYILVDGVDTSASILTSNQDNPNIGNVIVRLENPPAEGSIVQIMIFRGSMQKYSKTVNHVIPITNKTTYDLPRVPSSILPLSAYVWVIVTYSVNGVKKQDFLRAPDYENFVYPEPIELDGLRYASYSVELDIISVYKNNIKLLQIRDYSFDSANNIIILRDGIATDGDKIIVEIFRDHDFEINGSKLVITKNYNLSNKDAILFTTFTNHDQWDIMRNNKEFAFTTGYEAVPYDITQYDTFGTSINTSGIFDLPRTVSDKSGVLVSVSRELLVYGVDYVILDNMRQIRVTLPDVLTKKDFIEIITTNPKVATNSFGFRIFKDMLNRTQYKRLDNKKTTELIRDLNYYDTSIEVANGSILDTPNRQNNLPGVININFERIEYMVKNNNVLSQLRRGTVGTAINVSVPAGTSVTSMSYTDTIPYTDNEIKNTYIADTAIVENIGIPVGIGNGTIYGISMVVPSHPVTATISINAVDITVELLSGVDISVNRNRVKTAINNYSNITGVIADRVVNVDHPELSNNPNGIDLIPAAINIPVNGFVSKTNLRPYQVTFSIDTQAIPPKTGIAYNITGSVNTNYNGSYIAIDSTETSVTLEYLVDPGEFIEKLNVISFSDKVGNGPYFVTFNIPLRTLKPSINVSYIIEGNINQKYNSSYYSNNNKPVATSSTLSTITFRYVTNPGVYGKTIPVITRFSKFAVGPMNSPPFHVTYTIAPQDTPPDLGLKYTVSGSNDLIDFTIYKNTSFYNGSFLAVASTTTSITLEYPTDPGLFAGGLINLSSITKINSAVSLNIDIDTSITVANAYILPLTFVPIIGTSPDIVDTSDWYRESIPSDYGQNNEMEVFVNGTRMNKTPLTVYDQSLAQDSFNSAGDKQIEADYSVNGIDSAIRFTNAPAPGSTIKILTKKGYTWYNNGETVQLAFSESRIAKFITATSVDLPK